MYDILVLCMIWGLVLIAAGFQKDLPMFTVLLSLLLVIVSVGSLLVSLLIRVT